jgi:hypothetical protein
VAVRTDGTEKGLRRAINFQTSNSVRVSGSDDPTNGEVDLTFSVDQTTVNVPFTNGDCVQRLNIVDARVSALSRIFGVIRRPSTTEDQDKGYHYTFNIVRLLSGSFDIVVVCTNEGDAIDACFDPPNETPTFSYFVA